LYHSTFIVAEDHKQTIVVLHHLHSTTNTPTMY